MRIPEPPRRPRREYNLPMINVVFLLLIFFLISAEFSPRPPFEVIVPDAERTDHADASLTLYLDTEGRLGFRDTIGHETALAALGAELRDICGGPCDDTTRPTLRLHADKSAPGTAVAALLPKLGALGLRDIQLITARK